MRFRPCIDIHNGSVKQIVGGSLRDAGGQAHNNYVSEYDGAYYADMYRRDGFYGGHIVLLNPVGSEWYEADLRQAQGALNAFQGWNADRRRNLSGECRAFSGYGSKPCDRNIVCFPKWRS